MPPIPLGLRRRASPPFPQVPLPYYLRSPACDGLGTTTCLLDDDCPSGAICELQLGHNGSGICANQNAGGGCGGLGWDRVLVGSILGLYIIVYGQCQSYTPQLVTGPLRQTPPNKLTEVLWGMINTAVSPYLSPRALCSSRLRLPPLAAAYSGDGLHSVGSQHPRRNAIAEDACQLPLAGDCGIRRGLCHQLEHSFLPGGSLC